MTNLEKVLRAYEIQCEKDRQWYVEVGRVDEVGDDWDFGEQILTDAKKELAALKEAAEKAATISDLDAMKQVAALVGPTNYLIELGNKTTGRVRTVGDGYDYDADPISFAEMLAAIKGSEHQGIRRPKQDAIPPANEKQPGSLEAAIRAVDAATRKHGSAWLEIGGDDDECKVHFGGVGEDDAQEMSFAEAAAVFGGDVDGAVEVKKEMPSVYREFLDHAEEIHDNYVVRDCNRQYQKLIIRALTALIQERVSQ